MDTHQIQINGILTIDGLNGVVEDIFVRTPVLAVRILQYAIQW